MCIDPVNNKKKKNLVALYFTVYALTVNVQCTYSTKKVLVNIR